MTLTDIKEYNTPNRAVFISSSWTPKAAVWFRWMFSAIIASFCWAPLMLLPLASKTWTRKAEPQASLTGFNRNAGHVTRPAWLSRCGDTPSFVTPWSNLYTPFSLSATALVYCSLFCSAFLGETLRGGRCWAFYTVVKSWVVTQNQRVRMLSAYKDYYWTLVWRCKEDLN